MRITVETAKQVGTGPVVSVNHGNAVEYRDEVIWLQLGMCQVDLSLEDASQFIIDLQAACAEAKILTDSLKKAKPKQTTPATGGK